MGWLKNEKEKLAFSSVQRISYAMIMEIWVRRETKLSDEAIEQVQTMLKDE